MNRPGRDDRIPWRWQRRATEHIAVTLGLAVIGSMVASPTQATRGGARLGAQVRVVTGITVLLEDSIGLVRGRRVGLLTNQTGIDLTGASDASLLFRSARAVAAGVKVVALFSPEHGMRGTEDRQNLAGGLDTGTSVPVYSLYGATVLEPPDSLLRGLDVFVIDLQDIGTRTWTYVASMLYAMRAAAHVHLPVVVLDRPNPITGTHADGPLLDPQLANPEAGRPGHPARPFALAPIPLRHGLTMGELARYFNAELQLRAKLHVVPARGWRRALWYDETGLPWVRPSPNLPSLTSALLYPALVAFEGSNVSVGRGTDDAFQHLGAPWLDADRLVALLGGRHLPGVRFVAERMTPLAPTDGKYPGRDIPAIRLVVTDREAVEPGRVCAALLWGLGLLHADSLRLDTLAFDLRFGSPGARRALLRGQDPDVVVDRDRARVRAFTARTRRYHLYN